MRIRMDAKAFSSTRATVLIERLRQAQDSFLALLVSGGVMAICAADQRAFVHRIYSIVVGDFTGNHGADIAVLGENGRLWVLSVGESAAWL